MKKILSLLLIVGFISPFTSCNDDEDEIAKTTITLNETTASIEAEATVTLTATTDPVDETVTWTSGDESIATVTDGVVTGVAEGSTTITATAGTTEATCEVTVTAKSTTIVLNETTTSIEVEATVTLTATTDPVDETVTWTSDDESIATVTDGVVTGISAGSATITATTGNEVATCVVTVTAKPIIITLSQATASIYEEAAVTITATTDPVGETVTWTSDDESIATVTDGVVTGISAGSTTITATAGTTEATCVVTVELINISLDITTASVNEGEEVTITATTDPDGKTVTWTSNDESIATVTNGVVTGITGGSATITAKVGTAEVTCEVTVVAAPLDWESVLSGTLTVTESYAQQQEENMDRPNFVVEFVSTDGNGIFECNMKGFFSFWIGEDGNYFADGDEVEYFNVPITINATDPENVFYTCPQTQATILTQLSVNPDGSATMEYDMLAVAEGGSGVIDGVVTVDKANKTFSLDYTVIAPDQAWFAHPYNLYFTWE